MANIGRLMVEISANISKLNTELNKGQSKITAFAKAAGNSLLSIGKYVGAGIAAAVASITYLILTTTTKIADLVDEASQFQLPVQELQKFQYAAKLAGVDAEGFGTTLQFMVKNIEEAHEQADIFSEQGGPLGELAKAFKDLGINVHELSKADTAQQFRQIGAAFAGIGTAGERVKLAMAIFGRSGVQVLNMFKDGLSTTSKEFDELGLTITDVQASAVAKWDDARTKLGALWNGFKEQATATVAPALEAISNFIIKAIKDFGGIRDVGKSAGEFVLKGLLMAIRGIEGFITGLSEGLNSIILLLETVAAAVLDAAKTFVTGDRDDEITKQLEFLDKDIAERSKPAGERAGKGFGQSFANGLKSVGDIIQAEIDKIQGKPGTGGFGTITGADGRTLTTGDQRAAELEADMNKSRAIIAKYDAISRSVGKLGKSGSAQIAWGDTDFGRGSSIPGAQIGWGDIDFRNSPIGKMIDKTPGRGWSGTGMNDFPDLDKEPVKVEVNVTVGIDPNTGNLTALAKNPTWRELQQQSIVDFVTGADKQASKGFFGSNVGGF